MNYNPQELLKNAEKLGYAHNCPKLTGWLTPISQEKLDSAWATEADVIEYIESYLDLSLVFVACTEFGWFVQEMVWSESSSPTKPSYSLDYEDWYKDDKLMDFELDSPFDYVG